MHVLPRDKPEAEDEDGGEPDDPVGGPHRDSDGGGGRLFSNCVFSSSAPLPAPQNPAAPAHLVFPLGNLGKINMILLSLLLQGKLSFFVFLKTSNCVLGQQVFAPQVFPSSSRSLAPLGQARRELKWRNRSRRGSTSSSERVWKATQREEIHISDFWPVCCRLDA